MNGHEVITRITNRQAERLILPSSRNMPGPLYSYLERRPLAEVRFPPRWFDFFLIFVTVWLQRK